MTISLRTEIPARCNAGLRCCAAWMLCVGSVCCADAMQAPAGSRTSPTTPRTDALHALRGKASNADAGRTDFGAGGAKSPISPSDQGPAPARVRFEGGNLTVVANNSDLAQILTAVAKITGMTIDGEVRSSRVYGVYGPRSPRDVLTDLLAGSGYNFIMVGVAPGGAPRQLLLTEEKSRSSTAPTVTATRASETPDIRSNDQDQLGPGAIAHTPPPPSENTEERARQNLERLKHMHETLKQQNPPQ